MRVCEGVSQCVSWSSRSGCVLCGRERGRGRGSVRCGYLSVCQGLATVCERICERVCESVFKGL